MHTYERGVLPGAASRAHCRSHCHSHFRSCCQYPPLIKEGCRRNGQGMLDRGLKAGLVRSQAPPGTFRGPLHIRHAIINT